MTDDATRMARAEQAKAALSGFLDPAFDVCRADYMEKLAEVAAKPLNNDARAAMEKLALAVKVLDQVRGQIFAVVADGTASQADARRADKIADLSVEQRRWARF